MKLGLASTKCGSSVGLASVVSSILSPPISFAMDARSGVVATTFNLACAPNASNAPRVPRKSFFIKFNLCFICVNLWLKLVRRVRPEQELELQPNRVVHADEVAVI